MYECNDSFFGDKGKFVVNIANKHALLTVVLVVGFFYDDQFLFYFLNVYIT